MALLDLLGVNVAHAATEAVTSTTGAPQHHGGSVMSTVLMLAIFVLIFYFLLIRPQSKRAKEQKQLMESLSVGDEVLTAGGILGRITKLRDGYTTVTIAKGTEITVQKASIVNVLPKGTMETD